MDGIELMKKKVFTGVNVFLFLLPALFLFVVFLIFFFHFFRKEIIF